MKCESCGEFLFVLDEDFCIIDTQKIHSELDYDIFGNEIIISTYKDFFVCNYCNNEFYLERIEEICD